VLFRSLGATLNAIPTPDQIKDATENALHTLLLNKLNAAMGVDGLSDSGNKEKIGKINSALLKQIGEDTAEFDALLDDYRDLCGNNDNATFWLNSTYNNYITLESSKQNEFLAGDFNSAALKRAAELFAKFNPAFG
jgi:hypothetical protein